MTRFVFATERQVRQGLNSLYRARDLIGVSLRIGDAFVETKQRIGPDSLWSALQRWAKKPRPTIAVDNNRVSKNYFTPLLENACKRAAQLAKKLLCEAHRKHSIACLVKRHRFKLTQCVTQPFENVRVQVLKVFNEGRHLHSCNFHLDRWR